MEPAILVGTVGGLWALGSSGSRPVDALAGHSVTALARDGPRTWAIVDDRALWTTNGAGTWTPVASIEGALATCLAPTPAGLFVGTEGAHLLRLTGGRLTALESFEDVPGRATWYTPWGDPADVRSMAAESAGAIYVNVHVGGVVCSGDDGRSWTPTLDIETDVHQVLAPPTGRGVVLVAAAVGLGVSRDAGESWRFVTAGLHARYLRAVAVSEETVWVTASTGPRGKRAAIYRRPLAGDGPFERCRRGLPEWFEGNIDTACLAASGQQVAFGTEDGRLFQSLDGGGSWALRAEGLPAIRCVTLVEGEKRIDTDQFQMSQSRQNPGGAR